MKEVTLLLFLSSSYPWFDDLKLQVSILRHKTEAIGLTVYTRAYLNDPLSSLQTEAGVERVKALRDKFPIPFVVMSGERDRVIGIHGIPPGQSCAVLIKRAGPSQTVADKSCGKIALVDLFRRNIPGLP